MNAPLRIFLGVLSLIVGVIAGPIPILQGWIFVALGLLLLFPKSKAAEKSLQKLEPKMPRMVARLRRWGVGTEPEAPPPEHVAE